MSEWKEYRLGDVGKIVTGKTPKTAITDNYGGNIPFLSPSDNMELKYVPITARHLTEKGLAEVKSCLIPENSVCVSCIGSDMGKSVITVRPIVTNQQINSIIPSSNFDTNFLYYILQNKKREIKFLGRNGTAVPILNKSAFSNLTILAPELDEQRSIASILSSLDSKIENNRKICANLEAQAQALFKHWFIDFAPFKDGKFVESELGMIPEGWRVGRLGEIADINPSRTIQKGEKATYLDMKNMPTIGSFPLSWEVKEYNGGMKFMNGDTLMARITPCLENGKIAYVNFLQNKEIAFGSTEYIVLSPKNNLFSEYLYFLCRYSSFINYAVKNMNGSSGRQRVSGDTISNYDMIIAPKEIYKEVEPIFKDIMSHIKSLGQKSILLSSLRDTLLPKLMSGEIKV